MENKKVIIPIILAFVLCVFLMFFAYVKNCNKNAAAYYAQGLEFTSQKDFQNAYYNFSKISRFSDIYDLAVLRQALCALDAGDKKTAYKRFKLLAVFSKDKNIAPYALYNCALINIEHKKYKSAYKKLTKIYKKYPQSDYKKAASYHLGHLLLDKNPQASKTYYIEYLEYAPSGRYAKESLEGIKKLGLFLDNEQKYVVAKSYYELKQYNKAFSYAKSCSGFDCCFLCAKILEKAKNQKDAKSAYLKALSNADLSGEPKDILYAIDRYAKLSDADRKTNYLKLMSETKHSSAYPAVLFVYAKYLPKVYEIRNYETIYQKHSSSYWAAESLWRAFWYNFKNNYRTKAKELAQLHMQRYKNVNSSAGIKYWYAEILFKEKKSREAKAVLKNLIKTEPDSYYAFLAQNLLAGKHTPLNTRKNMQLINVADFSANDLNSLFNSDKNLVNLAILGDIEVLEKLRLNDDFQKSYILHKKNNVPYSLHLAKEALNALEIKPPAKDVRYKLAYPIVYSKKIQTYSQMFSQNPYLMLALIREESAFNPRAASAVGAAGLMQLMPSTASSLGFGEIGLEQLYNPQLNIEFGIKYFSNLVNLFDKNEMLAVLSYNGGPSNVAAWKNSIEHESFDEFVEDIPYSETQTYIRRVFRSYWNYVRIYAK